MKDTDENSRKKTKVIIMELARKKQIRTVEIPEELVAYTKQYMNPGVQLLSGKKDTPLDARTLENKMGRIFDERKIKNITFQRLIKTYKQGQTDMSILSDVFGKRSKDTPTQAVFDRPWLLLEMKNVICSLRGLLGLGSDEIADYLGLSESSYLDIEYGRRELNRTEYISLLLFFHSNERTEPIVESLGLYPGSLKRMVGSTQGS